MLFIKLIMYFWVGTIVWFLLFDALRQLFIKFRDLDKETVKSINLGTGFVLLGSGFFGLLSGTSFNTSEFEIFVRILLAFIFGIIAIKYIIKGV